MLENSSSNVITEKQVLQ